MIRYTRLWTDSRVAYMLSPMPKEQHYQACWEEDSSLPLIGVAFFHR